MNIRRLIAFIAWCTVLTLSSSGCYKKEWKTYPHTEIRAAIDIGSGATKLRIAEVNVKGDVVENIVYETHYPVLYQEALENSSDGTFDEEIMDIGFAALKKCSEAAERYGANAVVAVATASFRKAKNVDVLVEKVLHELHIPIHIIDQRLEGILTFKAVASREEYDVSKSVVWDIGGGSIQLSTYDEDEQLMIYKGHEASTPFKKYIIEELQRESLATTKTPNPMTKVDMWMARRHAREIAGEVGQEIRDRIKEKEITIIGVGNIFNYGIYPLVGEKAVFSRGELYEKTWRLEGKSDEELGGGPFADVALSNAILILGFMDELGIEEMTIVDVNTADGALIYSEFWE
jgi:exopolyphosphatase / guanosine-5'-triphosphate,3'-diphosphate pyrophosphatase